MDNVNSDNSPISHLSPMHPSGHLHTGSDAPSESLQLPPFRHEVSLQVSASINNKHKHMSLTKHRDYICICDFVVLRVLCNDDQSEPLCICLATMVLFYFTDLINVNFLRKM